jgi:hypothetical protein
MRTDLPDCLKPTDSVATRKSALDVYDLAVRLELDGVTDAVAWNEYGFRTTLLMAKAHFGGRSGGRQAAAIPKKRVPILEYLNGISFAIPVLICALSTLLYRLSLWGGDLSPDVAAAVAIGTVSSFIATGGIVQASARRSLFLIHTGDWEGAAHACRMWSMLGAGMVGAWALAGWIFNLYFGLLPFPLDWVAIAFHCALGLLWLACGVLYVLEKNLFVGAAVVAGIATVALCHRVLAMPLLVSQLIGIVVTGAICARAATAILSAKSSRGWKPDRDIVTSRMVHILTPFFVYGCVYYLFLFADRWVAWTAHTGASSLTFQFRGDYETALDVAMIAFVFQVGWVHTSMLTFYERIQVGQARHTVVDVALFNREMFVFYVRRVAAFLPFGALSGWLVYWAAIRLQLLPSATMREVAAVALFGYPLLVLGLWNAGMFFALSRPRFVLFSAGAGLVVDIVCGYILSRVGGYQYAVYGFAAGSAVFALLTIWFFVDHTRTIDHHHYASSA